MEDIEKSMWLKPMSELNGKETVKLALVTTGIALIPTLLWAAVVMNEERLDNWQHKRWTKKMQKKALNA